ncbi:MAG: hypothetical protein KDA28_11195, partial [Phycisphaerales bacterium]|nr:hypothetical protein [Phycisphaerales bacterium]
MGRTNWVILWIGLIGCTALSFMLRRGLELGRDARVGDVVREVQAIHGNVLLAPPRFAIEPGSDLGVLTLEPRLRHRSAILAQEVGESAWRAAGAKPEFARLRVVVPASEEYPLQTFEIAPPLLGSRRGISAASGKVPTAPGTTKSSTSKSSTVKPGTVKPGTVKPETVKPETVKPETVKPETVKPESLESSTAAGT